MNRIKGLRSTWFKVMATVVAVFSAGLVRNIFLASPVPDLDVVQWMALAATALTIAEFGFGDGGIWEVVDKCLPLSPSQG